MRRAQVNGQDSEATKVVAHARRAARRGRRPSMHYKGERNPQLALEMALYDCGYTDDNWPQIPLHPAPLPLRLYKPWLREVRQWLHRFRMVLNKAGKSFDWPHKLTDSAVEALLPRLIEMAAKLGTTIAPLRYDNSQFTGGDLNELALAPNPRLTADGSVLVPYHTPAHTERVRQQGAGWLDRMAANTNPFDPGEVARLQRAIAMQLGWTDLVADV